MMEPPKSAGMSKPMHTMTLAQFQDEALGNKNKVYSIHTGFDQTIKCTTNVSKYLSLILVVPLSHGITVLLLNLREGQALPAAFHVNFDIIQMPSLPKDFS